MPRLWRPQPPRVHAQASPFVVVAARELISSSGGFLSSIEDVKSFFGFLRVEAEAKDATTTGGRFGLGAALGVIAAVAAIGAVLLRRKGAHVSNGEDLH